jgi:hypothetical protein
MLGGSGAKPSLPRDRIGGRLTKEVRARRLTRHRRLLQQNLPEIDICSAAIDRDLLGHVLSNFRQQLEGQSINWVSDVCARKHRRVL